MPMRSLAGACWAEATPVRTRRARRTLVTINPLLRFDPLVHVGAVHAFGLRADPRIVGLFGLIHLVVDDAEVDERFGHAAAQRFKLADLARAQAHRGAVDL